MGPVSTVGVGGVRIGCISSVGLCITLALPLSVFAIAAVCDGIGNSDGL